MVALTESPASGSIMDDIILRWNFSSHAEAAWGPDVPQVCAPKAASSITIMILWSAGRSTKLQRHITANSLRAKLDVIQANLTSRHMHHLPEAGKAMSVCLLPRGCGAPHMYITVTARPRRLSFSSAQVNCKLLPGCLKQTSNILAALMMLVYTWQLCPWLNAGGCLCSAEAVQQLDRDPEPRAEWQQNAHVGQSNGCSEQQHAAHILQKEGPAAMPDVAASQQAALAAWQHAAQVSASLQDLSEVLTASSTGPMRHLDSSRQDAWRAFNIFAHISERCCCAAELVPRPPELWAICQHIPGERLHVCSLVDQLYSVL